MKTGLIHIYTGDGKGKTTAALGLTLRALGCGLVVSIFQFCKNTPTGELNCMKKLERLSIARADTSCTKFAWDMTEEELAEWRDAQQALFDDACEAAGSPDVDLVVLDEIMGAIAQGAIDDSQVRYLMTHKYRGTELVLTGRDAPKSLIEVADYVTDMKAVKHPCEHGVFARKGIEY